VAVPGLETGYWVNLILVNEPLVIASSNKWHQPNVCVDGNLLIVIGEGL
jgi:hypothetical protein